MRLGVIESSSFGLPAVKAVRFTYKPTQEILDLIQTFKQMCNDAVYVALTEKPKNRFDLISKSYRRLREYGLHSHYILSACEVAYSAYQNEKRRSNPYIKKPFLKLDNQSYKLDYLLLRIPIQSRKFAFITLQGSRYHLSYLADKSLKRGSVTITDSTVVIAFSKETAEIEPHGRIGIDVNERNVTWSDSSGRTERENTSAVAELKERYHDARARIAQRTQKDRRIQQRLLSRYGRREKDRTTQALHRISKRIVEHAKVNRFSVVMENLKGIRKLYRKGNGQGTSYRGRMNSWVFHEFQRQVEYKARWEGIPVVYINPKGTSSKCPECGSPLIELEGRRLMCPSCRQTGDRDEIATRNIMACVVPQAQPSACSHDGERSDDCPNPPSRMVEVTVGHEPIS